MISDLKMTSSPKTRSGNTSGLLVNFTDDVTGEQYEYELIQKGENQISAIFGNEEDSFELSMNIVRCNENECIIEQECEGLTNSVKITLNKQNHGENLFTFNYNTVQTRGVVVETWWQCVKRLALNEDVALVTGVVSVFYPPTFIAVAGAAGIICNDTRVRLQKTVKN